MIASKPKRIIYFLVFVFSVLFISLVFYLYNQFFTTPDYGMSQPSIIVSTDSGVIRAYFGTVQKGADIPDKTFCSEGYYLLADEGNYFENQTTMLLLKNPADKQSPYYDAGKAKGKRVTIKGLHPDRQLFCEALICSCEDYLVVDTVTVR